jgi:class 3 adenylate cyclase
VSEPAATPANSAAPSGERRQVTALFADMAGFTPMSERLGEEGTFSLIQPIYALMTSAVREHGGSVQDFTGDGIIALFGVPDAVEDAPLRACALDWRSTNGSRLPLRPSRPDMACGPRCASA